MIKTLLLAISLLTIISCNNEQVETPVSTVDSNTAEPADTTNPLLYLDNPNSDSFSIAIDSADQGSIGDTAYHH